MKRTLTTKQRRFVDEYCRDLNATQAAIRAGYSRDSARTIGSENLEKPAVAEAVKARLDVLSMGTDEVLIRLTEQARALYADFIREDGTVDLKGLTKAGLSHLVKSTKFNAQGQLQVEFHDAQAALRDLAKLRGLFVNRMHINDERTETADQIASRLLAGLPGGRRDMGGGRKKNDEETP